MQVNIAYNSCISHWISVDLQFGAFKALACMSLIDSTKGESDFVSKSNEEQHEVQTEKYPQYWEIHKFLLSFMIFALTSIKNLGHFYGLTMFCQQILKIRTM